MKRVEDPSLLAELDQGPAPAPSSSPPAPPARKAVSDPSVLALLEGEVAPGPSSFITPDPKLQGAADYQAMIDEGTQAARPYENVFPPLLAHLTDDAAQADFVGKKRREGERLAAESIARGEAGFRGVTADDLRPRTLVERGRDTLSQVRAGAQEGLALIPELPVNVLNTLMVGADQAFSPVAGDAPVLQQPEFVQELSGTIRGNADEDMADTTMQASLLREEMAAAGADQGFWEGLATQIKFGVTHPGAVSDALAHVGGQMAGGGIVPGGSVWVNLIAQGLQAGGMNASEVRETLQNQMPPPNRDDIERAVGAVFGPSAAVNTLLPKIIPGGAGFERLVAGQLGRGTAGNAARLATPLIGEPVTEGIAEGTDKVMANLATGEEPLKGAGTATGQGMLVGTPLGAVAGVADVVAAEAAKADDVDNAAGVVDLLDALGMKSDPASILRPQPAPAPTEATTPAAEAPAATTPPAPAPAPQKRTPAEIGSVIDNRLAELEQASRGRLEKDEVAGLVKEADELVGLLGSQRKLREAGGLRSPDNTLTDAEMAQAETRLLEVRTKLEAHGAGQSAATQRQKLQAKLDRIDNDNDLAALADELAPPVPQTPAAGSAAVQQEVRGEQAEDQEGSGQEGRQEGQGGVEGAGRVSGEAQADQQGPVTDPLAPRVPPAPALAEGATREQLVAAVNAARTPAEKSAAAAAVAAFDQANPDAPKLRRETIKARVERSLGTAFRGVNVHASVKDAPEHLRPALEQEENADVEGLYDPTTGEVHIFEDNLDTSRMPAEDRAIWVAAHERMGHAGIRGMFQDKGGSAAVAAVLDRARQNPSVARIVKAMEQQRPESGPIVIEEALAELAAALHTGNFGEIKARYGVDFSAAEKGSIRQFIDTIIKRVREALGLSEKVSDEEIIQLLADANRYARDNDAAPTGRAARQPIAQRAFNGSPTRDITKMSTDKIGTGAGNRLYGWGIYLSNMRDVADTYRRGTSAVEARRGGQLADEALQKFGGNRVNALEDLQRRLRRAPAAGKGEIEGAIAFIRADNNRGQLYEVEIPEDSDLLNWDRRVSTLPPEVQLMVQAAVEGVGLAYQDKLGSDIYRELELKLGSDKAASQALDAAGVPGLKFMDGTNRRIGEPVTYNYVIWNEDAMGEPQPLIASRKAVADKRFAGLEPDQVRTLTGVLKNLTPDERAKVTNAAAKKIIAQLSALPGKQEFAAAAIAGGAKRGWYAQSARTISDVFGVDAPRFAMLLAAMSPQTSVESNLRNALNTWSNWVAAGRPTERDAIIQVMGRSVEGGRGVDSVLNAWINNSVRALTGDPDATVLSGPKVNSFFKNLVGNVNEVTNDAWMASFALVNQTIFKGQLNENTGDPGKGSGYLAMNARVRETAAYLTKLTGETWTPAEVQETIWSWAKTVYEAADAGQEIRSAKELVTEGAITDEAIASTPDFGTLFADPQYATILEEAGYVQEVQQLRARRDSRGEVGEGAEPARRTEGSPLGESAQRRLDARNASRLDALRKRRLDAERETLTKQGISVDDEVPFSRRQFAADPYTDGKRGTDLAGLPSVVPVPGLGKVAFHGFKPAQDIAAAYMAARGLGPAPSDYVKVDPERAARIAAAYDRAKHDPQDPEVKAAYRAMIDETLAQYQEIVKTGLVVEFIQGDDPYAASPRLAILDVVDNNHLWVFPTTDGFGSSDLDVSDNPLLEETAFEISGRKALANDIFRVVHDYFGHIKDGVGFRADGEENAWRSHSAMYSPLARRAMTSETRGQNSWVNYGPNGEANRTASSNDTVFADQKTTLLPEWVSEEGAGDEIVASRRPIDRTKITRTNEFRDWFYPSAMRGDLDTGEGLDPIIFYHGTYAKEDFTAFDRNKAGYDSSKTINAIGSWFADDPENANIWAGAAKEVVDSKLQRGDDLGVEARVMPVYLKIVNPLYASPAELKRFWQAHAGGDARFRNGDPEKFREWLRSMRYDGIVLNAQEMDSTMMAPGHYVVALEPEQIKSAVGNSGAFDPKNPSIIASRGWHAKPVQKDAVAVVGVHYGNTRGLKQLDPKKAGTGAAGRERRRFGMGNFGAQGGTSARIGFYVQDTENLPPAEDVVFDGGGRYPYRVKLTNLYDLDNDPRGLVGRNDDETEENISEAGFDGFVAGAQSGINGRVAVVFDVGDKKIPVEDASGIVASRRVNFDRDNGIGNTPDGSNIDYMGYEVQMRPSQFLALATPRNEDISGGLREAMANGEAIAPAQLYVNFRGDKPKVVQHEGRSRMAIIKELQGDTPVPVQIIATGGDRARHITPEMRAAFRQSAISQRGVETANNHDDDIVASRRTPQQARQQRAAKLANFPQGSPTQPIPGGRFQPLKEAADAVRQKLQDKMLPILRGQEATGATNAPGVTSLSLPDALNAYRMESLMYGRTRDRLEKADRDFVLKLQTQMKRLDVSIQQLEDYLLARHAPERNARIAQINQAIPDGGSGITTADAQAIMAGQLAGPYSGKPLDATTRRNAAVIAQTVDAMRDEALQNLVRSGQLTPALVAELQRRYRHYVPLRGLEGVEDATGQGTGRGLSVVGKGIKRALGRKTGSYAQNILGEMVGDLQRSIVASEKSRVAEAFLKFALANPNKDLYEVEPVDLEWKWSEATGQAYLGVRNAQEDADTTMVVQHNGSPVRVRFNDPDLARAMVNLDAPELGVLLKVMGAINRWRSAVLTRFNPAFGPVNIARDAQFGIVAVSAEKGAAVAAKTAAGYPMAMRALWRDSRDPRGNPTATNKTWDDWAREYGQSGAKTGLTQVDDVVNLQRKLAQGSVTLMKLAADGKPFSLAREAVKRGGGPILKVIEDFNDATENALRLSVYVALRESGESVERAAEYAKNVTINFNRKGEVGPTLNAVYLFYNAAMQGAAATTRVLRNPKVAAFLGGMAALQYMMAASMMGDDDDDGITSWDKVPDYVKRTSLVIPLGHVTGNPDDYYALPMPYGFNVAPYAGGRVAQYAEHGRRTTDTSVVADIIKSTTEAFSPVPLSEGGNALFGDQLGFMMGLYGNTDDFGNPIVNDRFAPEGTPKALLGRPDTAQAYHIAARAMAVLGGGDLAKRVAPVGPLDVAPEQIEAVVNYIAGGLGSLGNKSVKLYEQLDAGNIESLMEGITRTPIAGRFVARADDGRAVMERYYGETGDFNRNMEVLQEALGAVDQADYEDTLAAAAADEPVLQGVTIDRYKRNANSADRRAGRTYVAGDPKMNNDGTPRLKPGPDSVFEEYRLTEKDVKAVNADIRSLRVGGMTNADVAAMMGNHYGVMNGVAARDAPDLGLPPNYNAEAIAPTRVRNRAINLLQERRQMLQKQFLVALERVRQESEE